MIAKWVKRSARWINSSHTTSASLIREISRALLLCRLLLCAVQLPPGATRVALLSLQLCHCFSCNVSLHACTCVVRCDGCIFHPACSCSHSARLFAPPGSLALGVVFTRSTRIMCIKVARFLYTFRKSKLVISSILFIPFIFPHFSFCNYLNFFIKTHVFKNKLKSQDANMVKIWRVINESILLKCQDSAFNLMMLNNSMIRWSKMRLLITLFSVN